MSSTLEGVVAAAADALLPAPPATAAISSVSHVLHVMTKTPFPGGHTTWVRRWVELDARRTHSLVVTEEADGSVDARLRDGIERSGGAVRSLSGAGGVLASAAELRRLAAQHDLVVLTGHPWDVVPSLAFSFRGRRPVVRLNHADHRFWLGCDITDVLVEFRPVGARCSRLRRGIPERRQLLAPLPNLDPAAEGGEHDPGGDADTERTDTRRRLGLRDDDFVLLSVGSAYKFNPFSGMSFFAAVAPALEKVPQLCVLAVGPSDTRAWRQFSQRYERPERLRALGTQRLLHPFFRAADVFLNSVPIGSETAAWEAAAAGVPIVCLRPSPEDLALITGDPDEFGEDVLAADAPEDLALLLSRLQSHREELPLRGEAMRRAASERMVACAETPERAYRLALSLPPAEAAEVAEVVPSTVSTGVDEVLADAAQHGLIRSLAAAELRTHPNLTHWRTWARTRRP